MAQEKARKARSGERSHDPLGDVADILDDIHDTLLRIARAVEATSAAG